MTRLVRGGVLLAMIGCGGAAVVAAPRPAPSLPPSASAPLPAEPPVAAPVVTVDPKEAADAAPETPPAPSVALDLAGIEKRIEAFYKKEKPPSFAVVVVSDGKPVLTKVMGLRDLGTKQPATEHTQYRIASITKTFTAEAILSLGIDLDQPAETYLPELAKVQYPATKTGTKMPRFTVRHMMNHVSGFPRNGDYDYTKKEIKERDLLDPLWKFGVQWEPGSRWAYSNYAVSLLGIMVARHAPEKSYRETIARVVTSPLGMTETSFEPTGEVATGYVRRGEQVRLGPWKLGASEAAGGAWSTIGDMAKYAIYAIEAWAKRPEVVSWKKEDGCEGDAVLRHAGALDGFHSIIGIVPAKKTGFVALTNVSDLELEGLYDQMLFERGKKRCVAIRRD